jgi:hypothetical protein
MMKPAIITLSPFIACMRVEMFREPRVSGSREHAIDDAADAQPSQERLSPF